MEIDLQRQLCHIITELMRSELMKNMIDWETTRHCYMELENLKIYATLLIEAMTKQSVSCEYIRGLHFAHGET